jgi:hypothetical protein
MSKYRRRLPQLGDRVFLTDGGLETTLVFHEGIELPASFRPTPLPEATRSWMPAPTSTRVIRTSWRGSTPSFGPRSRG